MSWLPILALAALAFLAAAFVLRLPRAVWTLFGAALMFGLAGYAVQGSPGMPAAPREPAANPAGTGELMVDARREFYGRDRLPSRWVVTADGFSRRGQYENAANFLRNAVEDNPRDGEAWVALGNALIDHADGQLTAAALYAFAQAEALDSGNPAPAYFLGLALLRSGRPLETRAIWAELIEAAPEGSPWRADLAERLARLDAMLGTAPPTALDAESGPGR